MKYVALPVVIFTLFSFWLAGSAEAVVPNPHTESGDCGICHVASVEKLRSWFTFGSTKRKMKVDLNQMCQQCHTIEPTHAGGFFGTGVGHATGKPTKLNRVGLPLAEDGTITCATTCHNMHVKSDDIHLQTNLLRINVNSLCLSCHNY